MSMVSMASGLLNRNMSTATGVRAQTPPAMSPAAGPNHRFTAAHVRATVATPSSAWGMRMLQLLRPKILAISSMGQRKAGVLSIVMKLAASDDPKNAALVLLV